MATADTETPTPEEVTAGLVATVLEHPGLAADAIAALYERLRTVDSVCRVLRRLRTRFYGIPYRLC